MSQIKLCPIRSSSKGNSTIVFTKNTKILVDCGLSGKVVEEFFTRAGLDGNSLDAIVVTHEHSDHTKGVGIISRRYNIPIFANALTWQAMEKDLGKIAEENRQVFSTGEEFYINDVAVNTFGTSHDAAESVGYIFENQGEKVAVASVFGKLFCHYASLTGSLAQFLVSIVQWITSQVVNNKSICKTIFPLLAPNKSSTSILLQPLHHHSASKCFTNCFMR